MENRAIRWTDDRCKEFEDLVNLINTVSSLNDGDDFIQRVWGCIKIAKQLNESKLKEPKTSFVQFLRSTIIENRTGLQYVPGQKKI